jgi:hypothetical protein
VAYGNHYPDPKIEHGPFRVLPRTDGGYVVADSRRPAGDQAVKNKKGEVMRWKKAGEAGDVAARWVELGFG